MLKTPDQRNKQSIIHVFHKPESALLLCSPTHFVEVSRFTNNRERRFFDIFFEHFWQKAILKGDEKIINATNKDFYKKIFKEREQKNNWLFPFEICKNKRHIGRYLRDYNALLFGSSLSTKLIIRSILRFESKIYTYRYIKKIAPFLVNDYKSITFARDRINGGKRMIYIKFAPPLVLKHEYGCGGLGSFISPDSKITTKFLRDKMSAHNFFITRSGIKKHRFLIEPFLSVKNNFTATYTIYDKKICENGFCYSLYDGMRYMGNFGPPNMRLKKAVREDILKICRAMQRDNYRGPVNFDFMELENGKIKMAEINPRYPYSIYPLLFFKRRKAKFFLAKTYHLLPPKRLTINFLLNLMKKYLPSRGFRARVVPYHFVKEPRGDYFRLLIFSNKRSNLFKIDKAIQNEL